MLKTEELSHVTASVTHPMFPDTIIEQHDISTSILFGPQVLTVSSHTRDLLY